MKKRHFYVFILSLFSLSGCNKTPVSCISLSTESVSAGSPIEFSSCAEDALSLEWFIDGPTGAPENMQGWSDIVFSNTFTVPGTYIITQNAYADFSFQGDVSSSTATFVVN